MEERICITCGETKPIEEYRFRNSSHTLRRGKCYSCYRESQRKDYAKNRKHRAVLSKKRRKANPERERKYRKKHLAKAGRFALSLRASVQSGKRYGYLPCSATAKEIELAWTKKCHVCKIPQEELSKNLHMDHCHKTGEFRGWLCSLCNMALGALKDSPETAMNLALYAEKHREKSRG